MAAVKHHVLFKCSAPQQMSIFESKRMPNFTHEEVVRALWFYFQKHEWSLALDLLHDDFTAKWPQSQIQFAISFFEFEGDKIIRATEYWADTYEAPKWQLQFGY